MHYDKELQFTRNILSSMMIHNTIADNPGKYISNKIDLGLRTLLYGEENYKNILHNSMSDAKENTIYSFFDEYDCNYMFLRLPGNKDEYFFVGPYLREMLTKDRIMQLLEHKKNSELMFPNMYQYYSSLPIIENDNILFLIMKTLGEILWNDPFNHEIIDYMIPDRRYPIEETGYYYDEEKKYTLSEIEKIYSDEKELMKAISQGNLSKVTFISSLIYNKGIEPRLSDTLRNRKNYLIILKTLLRKAAEHGGVHPFHIDRLSSKYARDIEKVRTVKDIPPLQSEMIQAFCTLVKKHSLNQYSYIIGKAITIISFDLTQDLSLDNIAKQLNVNSSYLSNLFRKECGITLTQYVINMRVEYAAFLLKNTDKLIHTISYECGIEDANYFVKIFKKNTGLTPSQYRKQTKKI